MKPQVTVSASLLALGMWCSVEPARADDTVVVTSTTPTAEPASTGPNGTLLRSGVFTLGLAYVPALVVAIESDVSADKHLYAPIVGPWFDLASRDECRGDCDGETVNKVLLVTDGVFQGLGALQILGSFMWPETSTVAVSRADGSKLLSFRVMPANVAGSRGVVATGEF
jgi:hypothetical protein